MSTALTTKHRLAGAALALAALAGGGVATAHTSQASNSDGVAYHVPDVAPRSMVGQPQQADFGQSARYPALQGAMSCDRGNPEGIKPIAGRGWMYYASQNDARHNSADVQITGWRDGAAAFRALSTNDTNCTLLDGWREVRTGSTTVKLFTDGTSYDAAVRVKNMIVSVKLTLPNDSTQRTRHQSQDEALRIANTLANNYPPAAG